MLKKSLWLGLVLSVGSAFAAPFVYKAAWTAEPNTAGKRGGEYRVAVISDPKTMNPFVTVEKDGIPAQLGIGTGLFRLNPLDLDNWIPLMAQEMPKVSNGGKRYTVKIRPGMKFSDGHEITADDWVTTALIHKDTKVGSNSYDGLHIAKKPISVKKIDKYTLQFDFPQPSANAYSRMSFVPWPDHVFGSVYKTKGADGVKAMWGTSASPKTIVSPGMWKVRAFVPGERVSFERNDFFGDWNKDTKGKPLPYLESYTQLILPDLNAVTAAYLSGKIDAFEPRNADDLAQVKRAVDSKSLNAVLYPNVSPRAESNYLVFNWNRAQDPWKQKLFRDMRFRQAMSHLVNRKAMIELALGGMGTETYFSVYPIFKSWIPSNITPYKYNPQEAARLLASLGFTKNKDGWLADASGHVLEFTLNVRAGQATFEQMGRIFTDDAKKIGVKVDFKPIDFNMMIDMLDIQGPERKYDAMMLAVFGGTESSWPFSVNVFPCGANLHDYNRPKDGSCTAPLEASMTKLFYRGNATLDVGERKKLAAQMLKQENQLQPMIYLVGNNYHVTFNNRIGGEYPRKAMNNLIGPRELALTFVK